MKTIKLLSMFTVIFLSMAVVNSAEAFPAQLRLIETASLNIDSLILLFDSFSTLPIAT